MLLKSRDEKRIFGINNFQNKSRIGNENRIFKIILCFWKKSPNFCTKWLKPAEKMSKTANNSDAFKI